MTLTKDQAMRYFQARLPKERVTANKQISVRCAFHDDRTASLSINLEKQVWRCHAGCGDGGMIEFERRFSKCDKETAWANICELAGIEQRQIFRQEGKLVAVYPYHDALGKLLFEKLRFEPKRFGQRRPDGRGGHIANLDGITTKPLYRLPQLLKSDHVIVCEGEKDADNVNALNLGTIEHPLTATTNFDGAGHWRDEYAPYFAGKRVVIFPDNDQKGKDHAEAVARSVAKYAAAVRIVSLPGLLEKQDVSDYLLIHPKEDLIREIKDAKPWRPSGEVKNEKVFVTPVSFLHNAPIVTDWLVEGIIQRGTNGFFCADPKAGKSFAATDLAISLAIGVPWLSFYIPKPSRVALISREDHPATTKKRMRELALHHGMERLAEYEKNLLISTREQMPAFSLESDDDLEKICGEMREHGTELAIFDVFNVLHTADENDAAQMRKVLLRLLKIQQDAGCAIAMIHHYNKGDSTSIMRKVRGSSAITGWAEWLIGISVIDESTHLRRMDFESKASESPGPIHFQIKGESGTVRLEIVTGQVEANREQRRRPM